MTNNFIITVEKQMEDEIIYFTNGSLGKEKEKSLAKEIVSKIDWNNSALMHKGLSWICENYLKRISI